MKDTVCFIDTYNYKTIKVQNINTFLSWFRFDIIYWEGSLMTIFVQYITDDVIWYHSQKSVHGGQQNSNLCKLAMLLKIAVSGIGSVGLGVGCGV